MALLCDYARQQGFDSAATGHYARIGQNNGRFFIEKNNSPKDQSYMLSRLSQEQLSFLIFPLGDTREKEEIRRMAEEASLPTAHKADSQEICFIPDNDYASYIEARRGACPKGHFVDEMGRILGDHKGILHYTVGQRKGLGNLGLGKPAFVLALDPEKNEVVLGDNSDLFSQTVRADRVFFSGFESNTDGMPEQYEGMQVTAKIRYAAAPAPARLHQESPGIIRLDFETPQRAATPGQSVVIYQGDQVLGGGFIC